jgi:UDP-N-acetylglucosamine 2-epimerase
MSIQMQSHYNTKYKILLFGSTGMMGSYLKSYFPSSIAITRKDMKDLSYDTIKSIFALYAIDSSYVVINCIGLIPQTTASDFRSYINANSLFPHILASVCREYNCHMIHITTDCVFSGFGDGNYTENNQHDETGIYGVSKSCGEPTTATVIRTSIIGEEKAHHYSLLEFAKKNQDGEIKGFTNHYWNGLTCLQLCHVIRNIIDTNIYWKGVRHIYSPDHVSKYELLRLINRYFNLNITITPHEDERYKQVDKTLTSVYNNTFHIPSIEDQIKELANYSPIFYQPIKRKVIMTITGIRPDFIRMAEIFRRLDESPYFTHILVHSGQHYDTLLSDVFFTDLNIRRPDYILNTGKSASNHYEQLGYLSKAIIELIREKDLKPDLIIFLGDSNTSAISLPLKKEGFRIGHVEAGMRSFDKRMLEEINRTVCDHCSDFLFVYHEDYKRFLHDENIKRGVYVVGNTIVEIAKQFTPLSVEPKRLDCILLDIHRPENFKYRERMQNIIKFANICADKYKLPIHMLKFYGTCKYIDEWKLDLGKIELIDLLSYKNYLTKVYHCPFIISDSGTGQEEPALLRTPVVVPRDYTERPQSVQYDCSIMIDVNSENETWKKSLEWIESNPKMDCIWLGDGHTAEYVVRILEKVC